MTRALTHGHEMRRTSVCHGISRAFGPSPVASEAKEARMSGLNFVRLTLVAMLAGASPALALEPINEEKYIKETL